MSDLESVDLSQESEGEGSEDMVPQKTQPPTSESSPTKNAPTSTPQNTQRDIATRPGMTDAQNGSIADDTRENARADATVPPGRPAVSNTPGSQTQRTLAQKPIEKPTEQDKANDPPKNAPVKQKRGRPRKVKLLPRVEDGTVAEQQTAAKPASGTKPTAPSKTTTAPSPKVTAGPPPKSTAASKTIAPRQTTTAKQVVTPKVGAKPTDGEPPRTGGRGRKRRLATKPVEAVQSDDRQDKPPSTGTSNSQLPQVSEHSALPQKQVAIPTVRKLYGAAKASALKRKRGEEEGRVSAVPISKARGRKKDSANSIPEVAEVPTSPPQKGRATKRARRQPPKDVPRPVPQEVIRIEDDDFPSDQPSAPVASSKDASGAPAQMKTGPSQENANSAAATAANATPAVNSVSAKQVVPARNAAVARGRQSLPSSFARPAGRRSKVRDEAFTAPVNRQLNHTSDDLPRTLDEGPSPDTIPDIRIQTQNESTARPATNLRTRRAHTVRHSTGNIGVMDVDSIPEPDTGEYLDGISIDEAVKSLLDEIQRNAIPFLLTQDRICDRFSSRIGEDVDVILKNSDKDVFQVFTDRVKDALVADRLRLAVASAKTDLRLGIEKLLREFARKTGAPLAEADSSLLLRNEAFRNHSHVKEDRKVSKAPIFASPRTPKPVTPRRVAEDSIHHEDGSGGDDLSDAADPIITAPRQPLNKVDIPAMSNAADVKKFVGYSYESLNLGCYRSAAILKLCAQPGGLTIDNIHELTPFGKLMIKNKVKSLIARGYLVQDVIREGDKSVSVYSTGVHVSDT